MIIHNSAIEYLHNKSKQKEHYGKAMNYEMFNL